MKYNKADKPKIIVLSVVLVLVVAYIAVSAVRLQREWKGKEQQAHEHHQAAHAAMIGGQGQHSTATSGGASSDGHDLRLKGLVYPPDPPERDPFYPVIAPRSGRVASRPSSQPPRPAATAQLPPLSSGPASTPRRGTLHVTGIISGDPATAVLRVGDDHYVVGVGDWLDNDISVQAIGTNTVTLREGKRSHVLRLGR
jgi:hypothetical protein